MLSIIQHHACINVKEEFLPLSRLYYTPNVKSPIGRGTCDNLDINTPNGPYGSVAKVPVTAKCHISHPNASFCYKLA